MDKEAKVKSWEKPWTTDEIRDQSSKWNLAGDAGLLKTLEQFAEDLNTRSNGTLKKLNTLGNDVDQTSSDISNVTNTFLLLSNKQFFENRVKDDDESTGVQKSEHKSAADEKAQPEPSDPKERVREALTKGMEFLDTMFSSVELVVGSDSEEEDSLTSAGHLLKPINPYTNRPLPCVIGSREFFEDDHVGLRTHSDEDDDDDDEDESAERDGDLSLQSSDSEPENKLQRNKISTPSESENSQPESEQSGVPEKKKHHTHPGDHVFGQESPPEAEVAVPTQTTAQKSFAAELAAKLGGVAAADTSMQNPKPATVKEKPDIYAQTKKHFDDLFGPPSDDEDDSLFGSGGKYSGGRGLFDDDPEDWKKPSAKKSWEEPPKSVAEAVEPNLSKPKDIPPKVPAFVIPNTNNLFGSEDTDHGIFSSPKLTDDTRAPNEVETNHVTKNSEVKTSTPNQQGDSLLGLIDDFHNVSAIAAVPRPQSDQSSLFGNTAEGLRTKDSGLQSDASGQTTFKKPAGGVSIFGNMAVNASMLASKLQSSSKELTPGNEAVFPGSSTSGVESNTVSRSPKSNSGNSSGGGGGGPLARESLSQVSEADEDGADQLFNTQSNGTGKSKKPLSLFDDLDSEDDDLLFSSTGSTGSRSRQSVDVVDKKSQVPVVTNKNVFDDVDLFGAEVGGGSDFDIFGAKAVLKDDWLVGSLSTSENARDKNKKDSKVDDISWLDDADTGDIFSDLNTKAELPACKEPTLHSDLFSDKLFDNIDEEDASLNTVVTPKPRTIAEVTKGASSTSEPGKLSETPKPVAVARTALPKNVQEITGPDEKPAKGEKPTVAPRKTGPPAAKAEVVKSHDGRKSPSTFERDADLGISRPENTIGAKHDSSTKEFVKGDGNSLKKESVATEVRPQVKPEPPKTLNIRQTTDFGNSLDDDLFNDAGAVLSNSTQRKAGHEDTTDGSASRGPTSLHANKDPLIANVTEKIDNPKPKLNIDPLALLPGAKPPTRTERLEKAASFDKPPADSVATLPSAGKDRVKIQVKRRPQTRRARQEAIRASLIENEDGSLGDVPASTEVSPAKQQEAVQSLDAEIPQPKTSLLVTEPDDLPQPQTLQPPHAKTSNPRLLLPSSNPLSPSTDEEDFFGVPPDLPSDYGNSRDADCNGNLFGDAPVLSPLDLGSVKAFSQRSDLFASSDASKVTSAPSSLFFDATENGNLHSRTPGRDPLLEKSGNTGADSFDDVPDLFGQKPARTSKTLEDLFPTVKKEGDSNRNTFGGDSSEVISASSKLSSDPTENGNLDSRVPVRNPLLEKSGNTGADNFDDIPDLFGQKGARTSKTLEDLFPAVKKEGERNQNSFGGDTSEIISASFDPTENDNLDSRTPVRDPLLEKPRADSFDDVPDLFGQKGTRKSKTVEDLFPTIKKEGDGSKVISASFDPTENGNPDSRTPVRDPLLEKSGNADNYDDIPDLFGQKAAKKTKTLQDLFPTVKKESVVKSEDNSLFRGSEVIKNHPPRLFSGSDEDDGDLFSADKSRTRNADKTKEVKPVPKLFTNSSKSSNDFRPPPKTNVSKGADSILTSKSSVRTPQDIFMPREEKLFSEDRSGGQLVPDRQTKITSVVSGDLDEDNLFQSSVAGRSEKSTKKGASLFGDDSPESEDLFGNVSSSSSSKKVVSTKIGANSESRTSQPIKPANKMQRSIFDDDDDEDIFSKQSSKSSSSSNISQSILGASADPYDLFASFPASKTGGSKVQKQQGGGSTSRIKVNEKEDVFEDPLMALKK